MKPFWWNPAIIWMQWLLFPLCLVSSWCQWPLQLPLLRIYLLAVNRPLNTLHSISFKISLNALEIWQWVQNVTFPPPFPVWYCSSNFVVSFSAYIIIHVMCYILYSCVSCRVCRICLKHSCLAGRSIMIFLNPNRESSFLVLIYRILSAPNVTISCWRLIR